MFLEIRKILRETPVSEYLFLIRCLKGTLAQLFSCEFCKISKNNFFTEHDWATDFVGELSIFLEYFAKVKECSTFNNTKTIISVPIKLDSEDQKQSPTGILQEKADLLHFANFIGKHFCRSFVLIKLQAYTLQLY